MFIHNYHCHPFVCCHDNLELSSFNSLIAFVSSWLMLDLGGNYCLIIGWFFPKLNCLFGGSLLHISSMAVMCSSLGDCFGTTAKLGPLTFRISCASVRGMDKRFITNLVLVMSNVVVVLDMSHIAVGVVVVVIPVAVDVPVWLWMLEVVIVIVVVVGMEMSICLLLFSWPLIMSYLLPPKVS